jgi:predicted DCC family thiol-disulfide oxidoreductase YuxK
MSAAEFKAQVGYLHQVLQQSRDGIHALFSADVIRRAVRAGPQLIRDEDSLTAQLDAVFAALARLQDVRRQRALFDALPAPVQDMVVLFYLHMLDQLVQSDSDVGMLH